MACDGEAEEGGEARARLASWEGIYPTALGDNSLRLDCVHQKQRLYQKLSYVAQQGKVPSEETGLHSCRTGVGRAVGGAGLVLGAGTDDHKSTARR